ncbi:META domain-containing protein [Amaricoccus solimangrovi]|uniref:META domain-containing protein n=1 Tax=Amaricoccus solimangrovi TaxID=2589815 RepID=A0A501WIQ3_9RHOB|nr:META domain-containing protein [Amaricoccus solimangrovi]TPE48305.1 META domain-containing protein [Amaricoccus solimangrovi]
MIRRLIALAAPFAVAACVYAAEEPAVPEGNWLLPGTSWKLVELDGAPFTANAVATLTEDGRIAGQAPCNTFSAEYGGHWPAITFTPTARTRRACPDLAAENAFFAALGKVNHGEMLEDSMLLTGPDTRLRLVKVPAPE